MIKVSALVFAAVLGVAGTASAGACEQLDGYRWASFIEGGSPTARTGAGTWDLRQGVVGGTLFGNVGDTPLPSGSPSQGYGASSVQQITSCEGTGASVRIDFNSGAWLTLTMAVDGKSATLVGGQNLTGMTGWIVRDPT